MSNELLLAVSDEEFRLVRPYLKFVWLAHQESLHQPHRFIRFAYFPNNGVISVVVEMKDGRSVEAGRDGAAGLSAVLGLNRSPLREVVQIAREGFRLRVSSLIEILPTTPGLQMICSRYAAGLAMQIAQTAAYNRLHKIEQRLARWLLIAQDRVNSGSVPITHEFLAIMLGTDRASVTLAAGILQRKKIIRCTRGTVQIVNRKKLEQFARECYAIITQYNDSPTG